MRVRYEQFVCLSSFFHLAEHTREYEQHEHDDRVQVHNLDRQIADIQAQIEDLVSFNYYLYERVTE